MQSDGDMKVHGQTNYCTKRSKTMQSSHDVKVHDQKFCTKRIKTIQLDDDVKVHDQKSCTKKSKTM